MKIVWKTMVIREIKETVNDINTKELSSDDIDDSMIQLDLNNFTPLIYIQIILLVFQSMI